MFEGVSDLGEAACVCVKYLNPYVPCPFFLGGGHVSGQLD